MYSETTLVGHVGSIEKKIVNDKRLVNLSIAVRKTKDITQWWKVSIWKSKAENFEKCSVAKGDKILIKGHADADAYIKDGKPIAVLKLTCNHFVLLASKCTSDKEANENHSEEG